MKKIIVFIFLFVSVTASAQYQLRLEVIGPHVSPLLPLRSVVNKELPLRIIAEKPGEIIIGLGWWLREVNTPKKPEWTVNGVVNGNNLVGQITMNENEPYDLTFKAPFDKPVKNPVEVIAAYKDVNLNGKIFDTTITCLIEIVGGYRMRLYPDSARLRVNDTLPLRAVFDYENGNTIEFTHIGLGWSLGTDITPNKPEWTVNGIVNGNPLVGHIIKNGQFHITFKAPFDKPGKNPVEVKAAYKDVHLNGKIFDTTITCLIEIVGGYTMRLDPDSAWLRVNDTLPLSTVWDYENENKPNTKSNGIGWWLGEVTPNKPEWTVNGIVNGNNLVGQIIMNGPYVTFKAPSSKPVKNPVEVIAAYKDVNFLGSISDRKLTSIIYIVDSDDKSSENNGGKNNPIDKKQKDKDLKNPEEMGVAGSSRFEVEMMATIIGGSKEAWGGIVTYRDEGSFIVSLKAEKAVVTNIKNNLEVLTNNCAKIILNPTTCTGMLHVAGIKATKVTPANPPGQPYPIVEIWFVQYPTELTRFTFTCPPPPSAQKGSKGKVDLSQMAMMTMSRMPALPPYIKFIAKNEEQIILEKGSPGGEIYYKFSVQKIKDD